MKRIHLMMLAAVALMLAAPHSAMAQRGAPQPKTPELTLPDFIQRRRTEIPPLTMHMDDGTTIPPFRPKG